MTRHDAAPPGLFVTGTDTGVGKTLVACEVVRRLRARGHRVGVVKPVETGVGAEGPLDALALRQAAGAEATSLDDVCPIRLALPAAPNVAAEAEGQQVDLARIHRVIERVIDRSDCVIVEGAGGLLVPLAEGFDMADLALHHRLALLVVCRASLGTLNHTRLTLEAARRRGLGVAGIVISHSTGPLSDADSANLEDLRRRPGAPLLGEVPPLRPGDPVPERALDLDAIEASLLGG